MRAPQVADFYSAHWPDFTPPLTLLSLPYGIERLVPMIEAALDGDPETNADDR
jgi:hypothetical protein